MYPPLRNVEYKILTKYVLKSVTLFFFFINGKCPVSFIPTYFNAIATHCCEICNVFSWEMFPLQQNEPLTYSYTIQEYDISFTMMEINYFTICALYPVFIADNIDGLVQYCGNSSALAIELPQSCAKPSTWCVNTKFLYGKRSYFVFIKFT